MKNIKRFNETKKEKVKNQEIGFNADSLEIEKDLKPSIKTEPVKHDEKELQSVKKNKIEKFESFITVNIDNVENMECDNDFELGDDESVQTDDKINTQECGCCDDCTGEEDCYCGCDDCNCSKEESEGETEGETKIINISDFINKIR